MKGFNIALSLMLQLSMFAYAIYLAHDNQIPSSAILMALGLIYGEVLLIRIYIDRGQND